MRIDGPVVVAVDGTGHSSGTLRWGVEAAVQRRARLVVAHVAAPTVGPWTWAGAPAAPSDDEALVRELRELCTRVARSHPELDVTAVLLRGSTVPALAEYARDAQLLVTGRRGSPTVPLTVGTALSWQARCPVALVDHDERPTSGPVVVGVDATPGSWFAAGLAAREAVRRGAPLHVLHAQRSAQDTQGRTTALDLAADLARTYPELEVRTFLTEGDPVQALVRASRSAGLLVVGARAHGWRRIVGRRVARLSACPVLVVRDEEP